MEHIKAFVDKNILPDNLIQLKEEIQYVLDVIKKSSKTAIVRLKRTNIAKFYSLHDPVIKIDQGFEKFLKEITVDGDMVPAIDIHYHWHTLIEDWPASSHHWRKFDNEIIDTTTKKGRQEARTRLSYIIHEITFRMSFDFLLTKHYRNVIGFFKLASGEKIMVSLGYGPNGIWMIQACHLGFHHHRWNPVSAGQQILSNQASL